MTNVSIFSFILSLCIVFFAVVKADVAPPGVNPALYENPQHYQHPQHPQQHGIPPAQQPYMAQPGMQQPQYMGQPQMQPPQYAAQPQYQQPVAQPHAQPHAQPGNKKTGGVLHTSNIQQEKEHIAEHMDVPLDTSKMSEQELQFHYFKMHDNDNNNKLDGCELIKSLIHWHEQGHDHPGAAQGNQAGAPHLFTDEELVNLIDPILKMDDANQDGYIDYTEFVRAQQKASSAAA